MFTLDDLEVDQFTLKSTRIYVNLDDHFARHCGVCSARNHILRLHNPLIHHDEEAADFLDDPAPWNYIHPEEKFADL